MAKLSSRSSGPYLVSTLLLLIAAPACVPVARAHAAHLRGVRPMQNSGPVDPKKPAGPTAVQAPPPVAMADHAVVGAQQSGPVNTHNNGGPTSGPPRRSLHVKVTYKGHRVPYAKVTLTSLNDANMIRSTHTAADGIAHIHVLVGGYSIAVKRHAHTGTANLDVHAGKGVIHVDVPLESK